MTPATRLPAGNIVTQGNRGRDASSAQGSQIAESGRLTVVPSVRHGASSGSWSKNAP